MRHSFSDTIMLTLNLLKYSFIFKFLFKVEGLVYFPTSFVVYKKSMLMDPNLLFFGLSASEYDSFMRFWLLSYFVALYQHSAHCLRSSHLLLDADIICVMLWLQWVVVKEVGRNTMWWCETWLCIFSNPLKMCQKKVALRLYYYIIVWLRWLDFTRRNLLSSLSKLQIGLNISSLHRKYWFDRSLSCYFCVHAV